MQRQRVTYACLWGFALALSLTMSPASAQWAWRDTNGTVQYSDTPPPSSVPQEHIVRQPGSAPATSPPPANATAQGSTPGWVDQNAEFMKRREQRQEQDQKNKEEKLAADTKKKNCVIARENLRMMETGRPIRQASENGGREMMSDGQREAEMGKLRTYLKDCR